jgi:diaminopimelate epimerase
VLACPTEMGALLFAKYEGLGNDFIVLDLARASDFDARVVPALCDRRFGIGADGVLLVLPPKGDAAARMVVINADGSVPEMCGNGLRCVALHVAAARGPGDADLMLETEAGPRRCVVSVRGRAEPRIEVEMGVVRLLGDRYLEVDDESIDVSIVDAGNPHAVAFREAPQGDLEKLGSRIARDPSFARGTNVEFVAVRGQEVHVFVWERGVGPTLACGTGACAAVAVAGARNLVPSGSWVPVRLPGGVLHVTRDATSGETLLAGPARLVFRGEVPLPVTAPS